jgi:tetratricopeptide (TPR) repeat protein
LDEGDNDKKNLAIDLVGLASVQLPIGALSDAECNLRRSIDLSREITDEFSEAVGHQNLGGVLSYCGAWQEVEQELEVSIKYWEKANDLQGLCLGESYRALRFLLMARANPKSKTPFGYDVVNLKSSIECAQRALELADETTKTKHPYPRDYVRAYWLLGAAYRANEDLTQADDNLSKALNLCRQINMVDYEANILLEFAKLHYIQGDFKDAQEKASEALVTTERSGYVLQGADVNLFLAQYALEQEKDKAKAKEYAESALKLAYCDGPPYYYKVAYEEAERMLEMMNDE